MSVNFANLDGYEALEEILNWKRYKRKPIKTLNKNSKERYLKNLFYSLNACKHGKPN